MHGCVQATLATCNVEGPCPRGRGTALFHIVVVAVMPAAAGTALGMFEPFRRGYRIQSYIGFITRAVWWPHILLTFIAYAVFAFCLVHFIFRDHQALLQYRDAVQYGVFAWTLAGYLCSLPALFSDET
jgi:hypothetical protein